MATRKPLVSINGFFSELPVGDNIPGNFAAENIVTTGTNTAASFIPTGSSIPTNGIYLSAANSVSVATNSTQRLLIDSAGQIEAASTGSAAAPTYSWIGDPNTGIYSPAPDEIGIATGGVGRLFIDANGANSERFYVTAGTAAAPSLSILGDTNTGIYSPGADQIAISTGGTGRLFVDANGDVGLGTSSPSNYRLNLVARSGYEDVAILSSTGTNINSRINLAPTGTGLGIVNATANALAFQVAGSEGARLDSSGRLGLGTSSPDALLTVNGVGAHGLGSAAAPSFAFTGDLNTGIYSPGADQLAISTNGTGRLFVDASGRIGVGTATPDANSRLHVLGSIYAGNTDTTYTFRLTGGSGSYSQQEFYNGATRQLHIHTRGDINYSRVLSDNWLLDLATAAAQPILFTTNGSERMRLDSSGRLGLGSSAPSSLFHAADSSTATTTGISACVGITLQNTSNTIGNYTCIQNRDASGDQNAEIKFFNVTQDTTLQGAIAFTTRSAAGEFAEKMRLSPEGRLGIGTASPSSNIHLYANTTGAASFKIENNEGNYTLATDDNSFYILQNTSEALRIDSSRRLLVGTSTNTGGSLLQVNDNRIRVATAKTPASATDTGAQGEICWDANYIYVCTATNTWKRAALSTW